MQTVADFRTYTLISDLANAHDTSARRAHPGAATWAAISALPHS